MIMIMIFVKFGEVEKNLLYLRPLINISSYLPYLFSYLRAILNREHLSYISRRSDYGSFMKFGFEKVTVLWILNSCSLKTFAILEVKNSVTYVCCVRQYAICSLVSLLIIGYDCLLLTISSHSGILVERATHKYIGFPTMLVSGLHF
jgi:hypothetical protein